MLKISYKLTVNDFDDSANTKSWTTKVLSSLRSNDDANSIVRGGVRMSDSTTPQYHGQQTCPRAQRHTQTKSTHARAGALVFSSSCLDESTSRVGLGQYPQYTRALFGEQAVGGSQTKHHSTPPAQHMSPTYIPREMKVSQIFQKPPN